MSTKHLISGSGQRNCNVGKPCGATCINRNKYCIKDLGESVQSPMGRFKRTVAKRSSEAPGQKRMTAGRYISRTGDVMTVLKDIAPGQKVIDVGGSVSASKVNWEAGLGQGARYVGSGTFGVFVRVPGDNLAEGVQKDHPSGVGVKYGSITNREVEVLKRVGPSGAGPSLIAARLGGKYLPDRIEGERVRHGAIAMSIVPGISLNTMPHSDKVDKAYVEALKALHLSGVAHNDTHGGNALMHNGKVRFIDFGISQVSWRAALAEAIGGATGANNEFAVNVPKQLKENLKKRVMPILNSLGLEKWEVHEIADGGRWLPDRYYRTGPYSKLSDETAKRLIEEMYHGI